MEDAKITVGVLHRPPLLKRVRPHFYFMRNRLANSAPQLDSLWQSQT